MSQKYIFQMASLTKKIGQREVLKDIWLAFYPGAKIGVLGKQLEEFALGGHQSSKHGRSLLNVMQ